MRIVRRAIVAAVCLLAWAGCRPSPSPGNRDDQEDHAGHAIPAHKPKNFPNAVHRLRELNRTIEANLAAGKTGSQIDERTVPIALDIANWLPEIAADSDMPEKAWNEVNVRSGGIAADYQKLLAGAATDTVAVVKDADRRIADLERLLAGANPS
jgi:hypothetical protein